MKNSVIFRWEFILHEVWVHRDSNPGSSPCKGDVITGWTMNPSKFQLEMHLNFENFI